MHEQVPFSVTPYPTVTQILIGSLHSPPSLVLFSAWSSRAESYVAESMGFEAPIPAYRLSLSVQWNFQQMINQSFLLHKMETIICSSEGNKMMQSV